MEPGWVSRSSMGQSSRLATGSPWTRRREKEPRTQGTQGHKTVLAVDDEEMILQLTRHMLEGSGYAMVTAADGPSSVAIIQGNPAVVDLVLLDMTMPGMTGDQVLWKLTYCSQEVIP